jgi:hypothetical protein
MSETSWVVDDEENWPEKEVPAEVISNPIEPGPHTRNPLITFYKQYEPWGKRYNYAALRVQGRWYLTGAETRAFTWEDLMDWLGEDGKKTLKVVTRRAKL